jgi:hypothetical protein
MKSTLLRCSSRFILRFCSFISSKLSAFFTFQLESSISIFHVHYQLKYSAFFAYELIIISIRCKSALCKHSKSAYIVQLRYQLFYATALRQCVGSGMFIPDTTFFHPGSEFFHPRSRIRIEEFKYFNPNKMVSKL